MDDPNSNVTNTHHWCSVHEITGPVIASFFSFEEQYNQAESAPEFVYTGSIAAGGFGLWTLENRLVKPAQWLVPKSQTLARYFDPTTHNILPVPGIVPCITAINDATLDPFENIHFGFPGKVSLDAQILRPKFTCHSLVSELFCLHSPVLPRPGR